MSIFNLLCTFLSLLFAFFPLNNIYHIIISYIMAYNHAYMFFMNGKAF